MAACTEHAQDPLGLSLLRQKRARTYTCTHTHVSTQTMLLSASLSYGMRISTGARGVLHRSESSIIRAAQHSKPWGSAAAAGRKASEDGAGRAAAAAGRKVSEDGAGRAAAAAGRKASEDGAGLFRSNMVWMGGGGGGASCAGVACAHLEKRHWHCRLTEGHCRGYRVQAACCALYMMRAV